MTTQVQSSNQLLIRPALENNESLRGYILRLAERNASPIMLGSLVRNFSRATAATKYICAVSGCNHDQLLARGTKNLQKNRQNADCRFGQSQLQNSHVVHLKRLVCPLCIAKDGISKCLWELRYYDVCHLHGCYLVSHCRECCRVLTWSHTSSKKCNCGAYFSSFQAKKAPITRQTLCEMMSKSMEKSLDKSNNGQNISQTLVLQIDWFFVLLTLIYSVLIPNFLDVYLTQLQSLNQENYEKLAIIILSDQNYCDHLHRTLATYAENDPSVLMKILQRSRTPQTLNKYFLPRLEKIRFNHSLMRFKSNEPQNDKSVPSLKMIEDAYKSLRQTEIYPITIYKNEHLVRDEKNCFF